MFVLALIVSNGLMGCASKIRVDDSFWLDLDMIEHCQVNNEFDIHNTTIDDLVKHHISSEAQSERTNSHLMLYKKAQNRIKKK